MSQVLNYGIPHRDNLLCDHPVCEGIAAYTVKLPDFREVFCCGEHLGGYATMPSVRVIKLNKPGQRNPEDKA